MPNMWNLGMYYSDTKWGFFLQLQSSVLKSVSRNKSKQEGAQQGLCIICKAQYKKKCGRPLVQKLSSISSQWQQGITLLLLGKCLLGSEWFSAFHSPSCSPAARTAQAMSRGEWHPILRVLSSLWFWGRDLALNWCSQQWLSIFYRTLYLTRDLQQSSWHFAQLGDIHCNPSDNQFSSILGVCLGGEGLHCAFPATPSFWGRLDLGKVQDF
jgi:hypothetical protein